MNKIGLRRSVLASSLALALFTPHVFAQSASSAGDPSSDQKSSNAPSSSGKDKAIELKAVTVTGSMIPRVEVEGPAPVVSITGTQIKEQGFTTLWEFLDSLPQMGQPPQDPASWGGDRGECAPGESAQPGSGLQPAAD